MAEQLMILPESALVHARAHPPQRGHAARPGTGPADQTCGTCAHYVSVRYHDKTYPKCGLVEKNWTHGPGSDIRKKDAACVMWKAEDG